MTTIATKGAIQYDASPAVDLASAAQRWVATADDYIIDSHEMAELAGEDLKAIKGLQKEVEAKRVSITGPLNSAVRAVNDLFRAPREYLEQAEATLKRSILTYTEEQERIAAEARRLAEEQERIERERLEAEARQQQELARKAEIEAQQAAEEAARAAAEGDQAAADAATQLAHQRAQEAASAQAAAEEATVVSAVVTVAPAVEAPQKIAGLSGRITYRAQVDDLLALARAVVEGKAPVEAICADEKFLSAQARAFKKVGELYPGVRAIAERGLAARSA